MAINLNKQTLFIVFRYTVYLFLTLNIYLFFQEESLASKALFSSGISLNNFIDAFSSTIDTAAWVLLIWLFEMETAVIPDEKLQGSLKWWLMGIRTIGYGFIGYAFVGYVNTFLLFLDLQDFATADVCALVGQGYSYVQQLDKYFPLTQDICVSMNNQVLLSIPNTLIIGTVPAMDHSRYLALADMVNAATWILVVILLEIEVFLQVRNDLSQRTIKWFGYAKSVLYSILFICAVYWGFEGDFIDFWDAFLWLVAFIFIELNIFSWNEETRNQPEQNQEAYQ